MNLSDLQTLNTEVETSVTSVNALQRLLWRRAVSEAAISPAALNHLFIFTCGCSAYRERPSESDCSSHRKTFFYRGFLGQQESTGQFYPEMLLCVGLEGETASAPYIQWESLEIRHVDCVSRFFLTENTNRHFICEAINSRLHLLKCN